MRQPFFYDITLRDGNQSLKKPWQLKEKQFIFNKLLELNVQAVEVGFPASSHMDFEACKSLADMADNKTVIFDTYNFENSQKRHDYLILNDSDIDTIINDIKNILDVYESYPITKDGDNWKIEINKNGENYCYSGDISNTKEENEKISMYIRNLVKFDDLILLDGNK